MRTSTARTLRRAVRVCGINRRAEIVWYHFKEDIHGPYAVVCIEWPNGETERIPATYLRWWTTNTTVTLDALALNYA